MGFGELDLGFGLAVLASLLFLFREILALLLWRGGYSYRRSTRRCSDTEVTVTATCK